MAHITHRYGLLSCLLTLTGFGGAAIAANAPTVSLSASPSVVVAGGQSLLTWSSTNATQCVASGNWGGNKPLSGSKNTHHLNANETYVLTCTGPGGSASSDATVDVGSATAPAPTVTIGANPSTVTSGSTSLISWSSSNATACSGTGAWSGSEAVSGSVTTAALTADATFALTCTGAGGTASQSTTVSVTAPPVTGYATLSWSPPTTNTDGTPVTTLSGYHIYYGNSASALSQSVPVSGATATSVEITGLAAGTWYFAVAADATDGTESAQSAVASKTI